jgi:hypothetical protein
MMAEYGAINSEQMPLTHNILPDVVTIGTGTIYSKVFQFPRDMSVSVGWQATSPGTVTFGVVCEVSLDGTNFVEQEGGCVLATECVDENLHIKGFSPAVGKVGRVAFSGNSTNNVATALSTCLVGIVDKR